MREQPHRILFDPHRILRGTVLPGTVTHQWVRGQRIAGRTALLCSAVILLLSGTAILSSCGPATDRPLSGSAEAASPRGIDASSDGGASGVPVASYSGRGALVRGTGKLRAAKQEMMLAPRLQGRSNRFTLTRLIPNGSRVKAGDVLAEFDRTEQAELARTASAQLDDLGHQIERRRAENRANAAKRSAEMREAQADLEKAKIQLRIAEIRSEIDRDKNRVRATAAESRVERLARIHGLRSEADDAELRILELQRDRQQVSLERAQRNAELLVMKAPLDGMVALEAIWRSGSRGPAQVGDQIFRGNPILRVFDPTRMELSVELGEPDGAVLVKGARADIVLDAYPELRFHGTLISASPVAAAALGSPIRRFNATFAVEELDPHLLPDLSAQVTVYPPPSNPALEDRQR